MRITQNWVTFFKNYSHANESPTYSKIQCLAQWPFIRVQNLNKVKLELSLCLTKNHAMKTYCGVEV